ncbi:MAG: TonB-dependent receptor [Bacteroidia bacterium]|nr:TonB-dependent receptor [Bacteroidia bacterium]
MRPDKRFFSATLLAFLISLPAALTAQEEDWQIDPSYSGLQFEAFAAKAEQAFGIQIFYRESELRQIPAASVSMPMPLLEYLPLWLAPAGMKVSFDARGYLFVVKGNPIQTTLPQSIYPQIVATTTSAAITGEDNYLTTSDEHIPKIITVGNKRDGLGKRSLVLTGIVVDAETGDPIPRATINVIELGRGVLTEENGRFRITLPKGTLTAVVRDYNHEEVRFTLEMLSSGEAQLRMIERQVRLDDVVISSQRDNPVQNTQMGFERINTRAVKEVPLVLGERDILKVATLLPGVQSVGEGSGGYNVRGAPADQNLFYLQHVPVYNTSHLFGFFSAFNSEALSGFSLYKSNIPAEFGGRLAAIFDIEAREGDKETVQVEGGISPITGRLLVGTPIQKGKSSALIGLRSTYSNWILGLIPNNNFSQSNVYFGDATVNLTFDLNDKNILKLFGYYSRDAIKFGPSTNFNNQNLGSSLSWRHFFNDQHDMEVSLVHSRLSLGVENNAVISEAYRQTSALFHSEAKVAVTLRPSTGHRIRVGANSILYQNDRGDFLPLNESSLVKPVNLNQEQGLESGLFLEDEYRISERITVQGGLRYNLYTFLGPQEVFSYEDGVAKREDSIVDTLSFGKNQPIVTYQGLDYRFSAKYALGINWSIKGSFTRLHQYIFLLSNTIALAPTDKWKLTDYNIKPMRGDQYSVGLYGNLGQGQYQLSIETYRKQVQRLVEYRDGADLLVNEVPEWDVLQGDLDAYGVELMLRKTRGRLNGWLNYTYSRAIVQVDGGQQDLQINFGLSYPANYDRPHAANLALSYRFNRRVSLSSNVVYASGKPITYPTSIFYLNNVRLVSFTNRNEYRVPDYFRMDISVNIEGNLKQKKLAHGSWAFSIYNLTGRDNVYNVYYSAASGRLQGYKVSIFAIPIFSATYNFKLGNYES